MMIMKTWASLLPKARIRRVAHAASGLHMYEYCHLNERCIDAVTCIVREYVLQQVIP